MFWIFCLIAARFFGAILICPLFADTLVTKMLKVLLSALFAAIVFPRFMNISLPNNDIIKLILLVKEAAIGGCIGYIFSFPVWLVENVGNVIDLQRGEQFGSVVNQLTQNPSSSISKVMLQGFITYFVSIGGILLFIQFIAMSFLSWEPGKFFFNAHHYQLIISLFCDYFYCMVILSLPILLAMYVVELTLGLFSSFVPQLNTTILSMPINSGVALFILAIYLGQLYHFVMVRFVYAGLYNIFKV